MQGLELVFVIVIGASIGGILRYLLPGRTAYGALLLPAIGASVASGVWAALLWAGLTFDGGWIWVFSFVAAGVASIATALVLRRSRPISDERRLEQLIGTGA